MMIKHNQRRGSFPRYVVFIVLYVTFHTWKALAAQKNSMKLVQDTQQVFPSQQNYPNSSDRKKDEAIKSEVLLSWTFSTE